MTEFPTVNSIDRAMQFILEEKKKKKKSAKCSPDTSLVVTIHPSRSQHRKNKTGFDEMSPGEKESWAELNPFEVEVLPPYIRSVE